MKYCKKHETLLKII